MEACLDPSCLSAPLPSRSFGPFSHRLRSNDDLRASLEAWLPALLEDQVLPRVKDLLNEVFDERIADLCSKRTPGSPYGARMSPKDRSPKMSTGRHKNPLYQSEKEQDFVPAAGPRVSEYSGFSAGAAPEECDVIACSGSAWVLHPNSWTRWVWDLLALLVFVVDVVYTTFEWAFLSGARAASEHAHVLLAADVLTGVFWAADLCVNFCTGYLDSSTCLVEMRQVAAAKHYLCTWFFIDFFASSKLFPPLAAQILGFQGSHDSSTKLLALVRVLKLTKLLRVAKLNILSRRLAQLETRAQSKVILCVFCILQLVSVLLTASHVFACILWAVAQHSVRTGHKEESWLSSSRPDLLGDADLLHQYATSMHLSVSIVTGMGTGQVSTSMVGEELVFCAFYLVSLALVGVIVNEVADMYTKLSETSTEMSHAITCASSFMNWYKVPPGLQLRVERYLQNVFDHKEHTDFRMQLNEWLQASGGLLSELNYSIFGGCLSSHPQLRLLPRDLLSQISNLCESNFFPPNEVVVKPYWKPDRVHWLRSGCMEMVAAVGLINDGHLSRSPMSAPSLRLSNLRSSAQVEILGEGDMLFHRNLLLPSRERSGCTCTCVSFCEVMTLEYSRVLGELGGKNKDVVQVLRMHAAIQEDAVDWLQSALGECAELYQNRPLTLFAGETVLHACVRAGAVECIRWLLTTLGWNPEVRDRLGKSALDLAKNLRNKNVVDAFVLSGAQICCNHRLPQARPIRRFKRPPTRSLISPSSSEELGRDLSDAGIDVSRFGQDGAKSVADLFKEIEQGYGYLFISEDGQAQRLLHVVRIRVSASCRGRTVVLSETEDARWFESLGQVDHSGCQVAKLPMKKMCGTDEAALEDALDFLWSRYIGVDAHFVARVLERGVETRYEEAKLTGSYPGLGCIYRVHEIPFWVRNPEDEECSRIGLPRGHVFEVQELLKGGGGKSHVFAWLDSQAPALEETCEDLSQRLALAGLQLGPAAVQALAREEELGLGSCVEDIDGQLVRVLSVVRIRVVIDSIDGGPKVLHELDCKTDPQLPTTDICSGHVERALAELWQRLLAPSFHANFGEHGEALDQAVQHFQRGSATEQVERFSDDVTFPGLRCLQVIYEVSFTASGSQAQASCAVLGLPNPTEASDNRRGLIWLPESDTTGWL